MESPVKLPRETWKASKVEETSESEKLEKSKKFQMTPKMNFNWPKIGRDKVANEEGIEKKEPLEFPWYFAALAMGREGFSPNSVSPNYGVTAAQND